MSPRGDLEVRDDLVISRDELVEVASRSGGPGGQHVNKTSTRVTIRWNIARSASVTDAQRNRLLAALRSRLTRGDELMLHSDGYRSQLRNREEVRERLAEVVRGALVEHAQRRATRPSNAARRRRTDEKTRRGATKRNRGPVEIGATGLKDLELTPVELK
jgi:ribosome-associated protein